MFKKQTLLHPNLLLIHLINLAKYCKNFQVKGNLNPESITRSISFWVGKHFSGPQVLLTWWFWPMWQNTYFFRTLIVLFLYSRKQQNCISSIQPLSAHAFVYVSFQFIPPPPSSLCLSAVCMSFLHALWQPSHPGSDPAETFRYCPDASFRDLISPWISFPSRLRVSIFISSSDLGKMMKGRLFSPPHLYPRPPSNLLFPAKVACISMRRKSAKMRSHLVMTSSKSLASWRVK